VGDSAKEKEPRKNKTEFSKSGLCTKKSEPYERKKSEKVDDFLGQSHYQAVQEKKKHRETLGGSGRDAKTRKIGIRSVRGV